MSGLCVSGMDEVVVTKCALATSMKLKHGAGERELAAVLCLTVFVAKHSGVGALCLLWQLLQNVDAFQLVRCWLSDW